MGAYLGTWEQALRKIIGIVDRTNRTSMPLTGWERSGFSFMTLWASVDTLDGLPFISGMNCLPLTSVFTLTNQTFGGAVTKQQRAPEDLRLVQMVPQRDTVLKMRKYVKPRQG